MIRFKSKVVAVLGGATVIASGALFASPAQAAMSCSSVPGQTVGADVKVGPVIQRVPAISNIQLCVGTGTPPLASVTFSGGTCTSNCLTVTVGGGDVDLEGATVSYREDGVLRSVPLNPDPVETVDPECIISVGMPDAPNPNCFIAIGPDDPTGLTGPIMQAVNGAVTTAIQTANLAVDITCDLIPDWYDYPYNYDFCTNPVGWTNAVVGDGEQIACDSVPDQGYWDEYYWYYYEYDFCTDPYGWTNALVRNSTHSTCQFMGYAYDPRDWSEHYFCSDPVGWTEAVLYTWCGNVCDAQTLDRLLVTIRRLVNENIQIQAG